MMPLAMATKAKLKRKFLHRKEKKVKIRRQLTEW